MALSSAPALPAASPAEAFALAMRAGAAASELRLQSSVVTLRDLLTDSPEIAASVASHSPRREGSLQALLEGRVEDCRLYHWVVEALLAVEGKILGGLVCRDALPQIEWGRLAMEVAGRGKISVEGRLRADRWTDPTWLRSFWEARHGTPFTPEKIDQSPAGRGAMNLILHYLMTEGANNPSLLITLPNNSEETFRYVATVVGVAKALGIGSIELFLDKEMGRLGEVQSFASQNGVPLHSEEPDKMMAQLAAEEWAEEHHSLLFPQSVEDHPLLLLGATTVLFDSGEKREERVTLEPGGSILMTGEPRSGEVEVCLPFGSAAAFTEVGYDKRARRGDKKPLEASNDDAFGIWRLHDGRILLLGVDGFGIRGGEVSGQVVESVWRYTTAITPDLGRAFMEAGRSLFDQNRVRFPNEKSGAVATAFLFNDDRTVGCAHVGDMRSFLLRPTAEGGYQEFELTHPDNHAGYHRSRGNFTTAQMLTSTLSSRLLASLGGGPLSVVRELNIGQEWQLLVARLTLPGSDEPLTCRPGDIFLILSDGAAYFVEGELANLAEGKSSAREVMEAIREEVKRRQALALEWALPFHHSLKRRSLPSRYFRNRFPLPDWRWIDEKGGIWRSEEGEEVTDLVGGVGLDNITGMVLVVDS